jgi:prolyl 4-hydroxylase
MELVLKSEWLYVIDNVLTPEECKEVIINADSIMEKSQTLGVEIRDYRTSSNAYIGKNTEIPALKKINLITEVLTELPLENQEDTCIVKYNEGEEYKVHQDHLDHGNYNDEGSNKELERGGDRLYSVMFYLNDDMEEGGTLFTSPGIEIRPKTGRCVVWKNYLNGEINRKSEHAGLPVKGGLKYIAVKWVRENKFL